MKNKEVSKDESEETEIESMLDDKNSVSDKGFELKMR